MNFPTEPYHYTKPNKYEIRVINEPIQITDMVLQLLSGGYPFRNLGDEPLRIENSMHETKFLSNELNSRSCPTAIGYDEEYGSSWSLPECIQHATDSLFYQWRAIDWYGGLIGGYWKQYPGGASVDSFPLLNPDDRLYIGSSQNIKIITIYGTGEQSQEKIIWRADK